MKKIFAAIWAAGAAVALSAAAPAPAQAQGSYPERPVRLIVGFNPGGGTDTTARVIAARLTDKYGQQIVVENRPGASGSVATQLVSEAEPDGYTLIMISSAHTITPHVYDLSYDALEDFEPVTMIASQPQVIVVTPSLPVNSLEELIEYAKANPGKLNYGTTGKASLPFFAMEVFKEMAGINIEPIGYGGGGEAMIAVLNGDTQVSINSVASTLSHYQEKTVRALGVTAPQPNDAMPEVPAVASILPGFEAQSWYGILAPAGTPKAIVDQLNKDVVASLEDEEILKILNGRGMTVVGNSPAEFTTYMKGEMERWSKVAGK